MIWVVIVSVIGILIIVVWILESEIKILRWRVSVGIMGVVLLSASALPWLFLTGLLGEREDRSKWPNVQGTILDSKLDCSPCYTTQGGGPEWYLEVEFAYEIEGSDYLGEQNWHVAGGFFGRRIPKEARAEKNSFLPGATLPVYYNPTHPGEAFVNPKGITWEGFEVAWWLGVLTPMLGLLLLAKSCHPSPWSNAKEIGEAET